MQIKLYLGLAGFIVIALFLGACGQKASPAVEQPIADEIAEEQQSTDTQAIDEETESVNPVTGDSASSSLLPNVDPLSVEGDIVIAGSSTVFPLAERMLDRFQDEGAKGTMTYDSIGSGAGFERFCVEGSSDIAGASRRIKDSEVAACSEIGREPIEFRVGTDAVAVVVSAENDFLSELSIEELAAVFSTAKTWADVNPSWPAEPIQRFIPGTDSGTFDFFVEQVFEENKQPILAAANTQLSEDDYVLVQGVLGSPYAIGFFGYAYYAENAGVLNILTIAGVEPTKENVDDSSYPLARPLFVYSDAKIMQEKTQVATFINFFLSYVNEEIVDVGYFPASDEDINKANLNWLEAMQ